MHLASGRKSNHNDTANIDVVKQKGGGSVALKKALLMHAGAGSD